MMKTVGLAILRLPANVKKGGGGSMFLSLVVARGHCRGVD